MENVGISIRVRQRSAKKTKQLDWCITLLDVKYVGLCIPLLGVRSEGLRIWNPRLKAAKDRSELPYLDHPFFPSPTYILILEYFSPGGPYFFFRLAATFAALTDARRSNASEQSENDFMADLPPPSELEALKPWT